MTLVGTTVGRIRIVDALGRGGMGEVYVGYDETLKRKVALKAIRGDRRLDAEARARFLREARILSQLDHPGICRIYEYVEGDDSDFLVLELIPGKNLKQALEEDELDEAFKLHVAERVNEALVAAHAQGVAHRDLKPENVMLTPDGEVKVLDFGLAYTVDGGLVSVLGGGGAAPGPAAGSSREVDAATTLGGTRGARPAPPSPDAPGEGPLTATARWSGAPDLGRPDAETGTVTPSDFVETRRGIVMGTVAYMSPEQARGERVTAAGDMYSLGLLMQELFTGRAPYDEGPELLGMLKKAAAGETRPVTGVHPDLATLIERLESVAPEARPTAEETAERLRWIRHQPARRLLRRLAAGLLAALLLAGLKYTFDLRRERNRAEAARREADRVLAFVVDVFAVSDPQHNRGDQVTAKDLLDAGAERIAAELAGQPRSQSRLMLTMGRVYRQLGLYDEARPLLEEGLAIRRRLLGDDDPEVAVGLDDLANLYHDRGEVERARPLYERALEIHRKTLGGDHPRLAASLNNLAFNHLARGEGELAEPLLERALAIQERAYGRDSPRVARSLVNLGDLYRARGELERAEPYFRRALELEAGRPGGDHLQLTFPLTGLAMIHYVRGEEAEAEPLFRRALAIQERVLGGAHPDVAISLNNLAELYRGIGGYARAEPLYRRALAIQEETLGTAHPDYAVTLSNLADLHGARGEAALAAPLYERALAIQERALGAAHPGVAVTLNHLADLYVAGPAHRAAPDGGPPDAAWAEELYRRALAIQEASQGPGHPGVAITLADLAGLLTREGRYEEAERLYLRAQASARHALERRPGSRADRRRLAAVRLGLGRLYQAAGAGERAAESWRRALALTEPLAASADVPGLHTRALALLHLGRVDDARPVALELLGRGWRHPDLVELCRRHGLETARGAV